MALRGFPFTLDTRGPSHEVPHERWSKEEFIGSLWKKSIVYEYVKPAFNQMMVGLIGMIKDMASAYPQDNEEGAYTIFETKAEDYVA